MQDAIVVQLFLHWGHANDVMSVSRSIRYLSKSPRLHG